MIDILLGGKSAYRHEMDIEAHAALLQVLQSLQGMVVLSGYAHPLYDSTLRDWRRTEFEALADGARPRTEVLWLNPACAVALDREGRGYEQLELAGLVRDDNALGKEGPRQ